LKTPGERPTGAYDLRVEQPKVRLLRRVGEQAGDLARQTPEERPSGVVGQD